jgi:hypothetical protein
MRTIIVIVVSFAAGVYAHKYKEPLKVLFGKLWDKIFHKKTGVQ